MPSKQIVKQCDICNEVTMHIQQTPNHILHLLLSLVTCGLWLIVWIIIGCCTEAPVCSKCGNIPKQGTVQEEKKERKKSWLDRTECFDD